MNPPLIDSAEAVILADLAEGKLLDERERQIAKKALQKIGYTLRDFMAVFTA